MSVAIFTSNKSLPSPLSPAAMKAVKTSFQGMAVPTQQYGNIQAWGPELGSLNKQDRFSYYGVKKLRKDTHFEHALSWNYDEPSFQYPVPGRDFTKDVGALRSLIIEGIRAGFKGCILFCAGDGEGAGPGYNSPDGWSYGREWLMNNFKDIHNELKDLDDYIMYIPGYDDIWYGWNTPQELEAWLLFAKKDCGVKYLGLEFSVGVTFWQNGPADFVSPAGLCIDTVLMEYEANLHQDSFWQIAARQLGPLWRRPADMPSGDDPNPPFFLIGGQTAVMYEYLTYQWVRGEVSLVDVNKNRDYARACGYPDSCIC